MWQTEDTRACFWWVNLKERDRLEDLSVDGRKTLQLFSRNTTGVRGFGSEFQEVAGVCKHDNEILGSLKCRGFLDQTRNY